MASELVHSYLSNDIDAVQVRQLAEAGAASGAVGVGQIGAVGSDGFLTGNIARDLRRLLLREGVLGQVEWYMFDMPMWDEATLSLKPTTMPIGLPHELVDWALGKECMTALLEAEPEKR